MPLKAIIDALLHLIIQVDEQRRLVIIREELVNKVMLAKYDDLPSEVVMACKKTSLDYAREKYEEIIATHKLVPLPEDKRKAIDEIMEEVRVHYEKEGTQ